MADDTESPKHTKRRGKANRGTWVVERRLSPDYRPVHDYPFVENLREWIVTGHYKTLARAEQAVESNRKSDNHGGHRLAVKYVYRIREA